MALGAAFPRGAFRRPCGFRVRPLRDVRPCANVARWAIVLNLFGGSGSTLIAAEQTGRRAFLMEIDPPYCDVIVQRWEKFTGKKAERIRDGEAAEVTA